MACPDRRSTASPSDRLRDVPRTSAQAQAPSLRGVHAKSTARAWSSRDRGIYNPTALALGNDGRLFVANRPSRSGGDSKAGWIAVYRSSGSKPLRRITDGTEGVASMAVDAEGYLYAANFMEGEECDPRFTPDGSRLVRKITDGVHTPAAIAE